MLKANGGVVSKANRCECSVVCIHNLRNVIWVVRMKYIRLILLMEMDTMAVETGNASPKNMFSHRNDALEFISLLSHGSGFVASHFRNNHLQQFTQYSDNSPQLLCTHTHAYGAESWNAYASTIWLFQSCFNIELLLRLPYWVDT